MAGERISWETCPHCGLTAAVGWRDGVPVELDCTAGYEPAHGGDLSRGGMGLWLARQLCDHVDITHHGKGVSVRLTTHLH
jgi:anti-sigma regulatory factor (Ser/Thr protein kinase)